MIQLKTLSDFNPIAFKSSILTQKDVDEIKRLKTAIMKLKLAL